MTDITDKAVDIKGNKYILVKDRILAFNSDFPNGMIQTDLKRYEDGHVIVIAKVWPDSNKTERYFTGWSQAKEADGYINKTSALENCETSAVGRALAMMGIGVIDSIASADEIHKATAQPITDVPERLQMTAAKIHAEARGETYPDVTDMDHWCTVHNKQMKERENRATGGKFYAHFWKNNDTDRWMTCIGKGYIEQD